MSEESIRCAQLLYNMSCDHMEGKISKATFMTILKIIFDVLDNELDNDTGFDMAECKRIIKESKND